MSSLDRHIEAPDTGVVTSELFIYNEREPGTGALLTTVRPHELPARETIFINTDHLQISFLMDRDQNTAEVILDRRTEPTGKHFQSFLLTPEFQTKEQVPITILFAGWKIVRVIDGKPLPILYEESAGE